MAERILMITGRADTGGGPEHIYQLVRNLPPEFEIFIAAPKQEPFWERFGTLVGQDHLIEIPARKITFIAARQLVRFIRDRSISLVHSHGRPGAIYARILRVFQPTIAVHTPNGAFAHGLLKRPLFQLIDRVCASKIDHVVAVSPTEEKELRTLLRRSQGISTILNGVEVSAENQASGFANTPRRILHITRFVYQKNSIAVLDILESLRALGALERFHLDVAGEGPDQEAFSAEVTSRQLSAVVTCHGAVRSIQPLLKESFCILSTSRWEGLPFAILEAMAHGIPPIASNVVGNKDLVNDEVGRLFPLGNHEGAARQILDLEDSSRWARASHAAKAKISARYSAKHMATETSNLYKRLRQAKAIPTAFA